jgi:hypothetical protein
MDDLLILEWPTKAGFVQIAFPTYFAAKVPDACLAGQEADARIVDVPLHGAFLCNNTFHFMRITPDGEGW